ncbi:MAG: hydroxymethylbilane synthase [Candidatus Latescibacterota bacterium]|nr:hydroxymethylbilane synthase [Candidatus Latescibacterota bacterium]
MTIQLTIGTRGSQLATTQSGVVKQQLDELHPQDLEVRIEVIRTTGDVDRQSLSVIGGQGIFTREIEHALLDKRVDLAVHSLKDLPTEVDKRLQLVAAPPREDVRDVLVSREDLTLCELPEGAAVATGSCRRQAQLKHLRPDLRFIDLRGNVDTRIRKVTEGEVDAVVLAAAGLHRLGRQLDISEYLDPLSVMPAPGQACLGLQMRRDDVRHHFVRRLDCPDTAASVTAERAFLQALGGGCRAPIAAWARTDDEGELRVDGVVLHPDTDEAVHDQMCSPLENAAELGCALAESLRRQGAAAILEQFI